MTSKEPDFLKKESLDGTQRNQKRFMCYFLGKDGGDTLDHIFRNKSLDEIVKSNTMPIRSGRRERERNQRVPSGDKRSWKASFINSFKIRDEYLQSILVKVRNEKLNGGTVPYVRKVFFRSFTKETFPIRVIDLRFSILKDRKPWQFIK